jgi:hypothetical protein
LHGVEWIRRKEGSEISDTLRRLVRLGLEPDLAERYRRSEVTLREAAAVLERPLRETLENFWQLGVTGNVTAAQALAALRTGRALGQESGRGKRARSVRRGSL